MPTYPSVTNTATGFYAEAVRHLADARVLWDHNRHAAVVASAHKAQELAVKAALILKNPMGSWDKLFAPHKPLTDISGMSLNRINTDLDAARPTLSLVAKQLEVLEPTRSHARNAEYPYLVNDADGCVAWESPMRSFADAGVRTIYNRVHEVVTVLSARYNNSIHTSQFRLPPVIP